MELDLAGRARDSGGSVALGQQGQGKGVGVLGPLRPLKPAQGLDLSDGKLEEVLIHL